MNHVAISGNLTADPQTKQGKNGTVLSFTVAVNGRTRDKSGEWVDRADFIRCVVFGKRAESLSKHLSKGTRVAVAGRLRYSTWETQDQQKRSALDVIVDDLDFMSARKPTQDVPDDDLPF